MPKILLIGGILVEKQFFVDTIPHSGQIAISNQDFKMGITSKVINGGRIIARYFPTTIQGVIGPDLDGTFALKELSKFKIKTHLIRQSESKQTGQVIIIVDKKAQSSTIFHAGANSDNHFSSESKKYDCLYLSTTAPLNTIYQTLENANGKTLTLLDPPSYPDQLNWSKLDKLDYITANRREAEKMMGTKITSAQQALDTAKTLSQRIKGTAIITLDEEGCVIANKQMQQFIKAPKTMAIDTTGAGDILRGIFLTKILQGQDVLSSLETGILIASKTTQIKGVYSSIKYALKTLNS